MCFQNPFSGLKKLKRQLAGGRHGPERRGANTDGEEVDLTGPLAQPEPHVETEAGDGREGSVVKGKGAEVGRTEGDDTNGKKVEEVDSPPQPDLLPLLKSVAGDLTAILKHCDVRPIFPTTLSINDAHCFPSNR